VLIDTCTAAYLAAMSARNLRPATIANYSQSLSLFTAFASDLCQAHLSCVDTRIIRQWVSGLLKRGLRDTTVRQHLICVKTFFGWCVREGYADDNPCLRVTLPRVDRRDPRYLSAQESHDLLVACDKLRSRDPLVPCRTQAQVALLLDTGLRASELLRLLVTDLELVSRSVRVSAESKGRRERLIPFGACTLRIVRHYLRAREKRFARVPWLWVSREGGALSKTQLAVWLGKAAKLAGIGPIHPHALRHTCATLLLAGGLDSIYVQRILDHRDPETTARYTHLFDGDLRAAYAGASPVSKALGR